VAWEVNEGRTIPGIGGIRDEADCLRLTGVQPGTYAIEVSYRGMTPALRERAWKYAVSSAEEDAATRGNWGGKYGRDGFVLCSYDNADGKAVDRRQLPEYVSAVTYSLNANVCWQAGTNDSRAPAPNAGNGFPRNIGCIYTQDPRGGFQTMTMDLKLAHSKAFQIALYFVDWDKKGRRVAVEMFDGQTLQRLAPVKMVRDFAGGKYLVYHCDKSVRFRIDQVRGDNATLSGIFFN
jgi:hypothetical protein